MAARTVHLPHGDWSVDETSPLGSPGGFGAVFAGADPGGHQVAIKRFHLNIGDAAKREIAILEQLRAAPLAHVIPILDAGLDATQGVYYIVMARAAQSLQDLITANGAMAERDAVGILDAISAGLQELGPIVHRDLKPANVLLHSGIWKLADFGIARDLTKSTSVNTLKGCMSIEYAAPEQWRGETADKATDVYALGCILYALIMGRPPFVGPTEADFRQQHLHATPPQIQGSAILCQLATGCLNKERETRPNLETVIRLLHQLQAPPDSGGEDLLAQVGVVMAQDEAARQALTALKRDAREKRAAMAEDAKRVLEQIKQHLISSMRDRASTLKDDNGIYRLGEAYFRCHVTYPFIPEGMFPRSRWDIVVGATITTKQGRNAYEGRSANLWFAKMPEDDRYHWWEVSYMRSPLSTREPYSTVPFGWDAPQALQHVDEAASSTMGVYQHGAKPKIIDGEHVEDFCRRWRNWFALAVQNRLECPRCLPED